MNGQNRNFAYRVIVKHKLYFVQFNQPSYQAKCQC